MARDRRLEWSLAFLLMLPLGGTVPAVAATASYTYPPAVDTGASRGARQKLEEAKREFSKSKATLLAAASRLRPAFEAQAPWQAAQQALKTAQASLDAAREQVLRTLREKSDYKAALADKEKARKRLEQLRSAGQSDPGKLGPLAAEVMQLSSVASDMERDAWAADPAVTQGKASLTEAAAKISSLEREFEQSAQSDSQVAAARQARQAADDKVSAAESELAAALNKEAGLESTRQEKIVEIEQRRKADAARQAARRNSRRR